MKNSQEIIAKLLLEEPSIMTISEERYQEMKQFLANNQGYQGDLAGIKEYQRVALEHWVVVEHSEVYQEIIKLLATQEGYQILNGLLIKPLVLTEDQKPYEGWYASVAHNNKCKALAKFLTGHEKYDEIVKLSLKHFQLQAPHNLKINLLLNEYKISIGEALEAEIKYSPSTEELYGISSVKNNIVSLEGTEQSKLEDAKPDAKFELGFYCGILIGDLLKTFVKAADDYVTGNNSDKTTYDYFIETWHNLGISAISVASGLISTKIIPTENINPVNQIIIFQTLGQLLGDGFSKSFEENAKDIFLNVGFAWCLMESGIYELYPFSSAVGLVIAGDVVQLGLDIGYKACQMMGGCEEPEAVF